MQKYTKELIEEACKTSYSYSEVLRKLGRRADGGSYQVIKNKIREFNIDVSHFTGKKWRNSPNAPPQNYKHKYSYDEIFRKNSPVTQKVLRDYIKRYNVLEYKCQNCGCDGNWQNGIIALEVEHIDGDNTNNEVTNLCYLCPNCHALTKTYRGRNTALKHQCVETVQQLPKS